MSNVDQNCPDSVKSNQPEYIFAGKPYMKQGNLAYLTRTIMLDYLLARGENRLNNTIELNMIVYILSGKRYFSHYVCMNADGG